MSRIVALDVGNATVGIAATDELGIAAHPVTTLKRTSSVKADLRAVEEVLRGLEPALVLVGLPLGRDGEEGPQARKVREFAGRLAKRISVPVRLWDETLSTVEAEERLLQADVSRARRKKIIDQAAALVILESYLASGEK